MAGLAAEARGNIVEASGSDALIKQDWDYMRGVMATLLALAAHRERAALALGPGPYSKEFVDRMMPTSLPPNARWPQILLGTPWEHALYRYYLPAKLYGSVAHGAHLTLVEARAATGALLKDACNRGLMTTGTLRTVVEMMLTTGLPGE